jgi:hypothetical protein
LLEKEDNNANSKKKMKIQYKLEKEADEFIKADVANRKYWDDCKEMLNQGKKVCILFCLVFSVLQIKKKHFLSVHFCRLFWIELKKHFHAFAVKKLFLNQLPQSALITFVK